MGGREKLTQRETDGHPPDNTQRLIETIDISTDKETLSILNRIFIVLQRGVF